MVISMNTRRTARKNISAGRRMDEWLKGKTPKEQLKRLKSLLNLYQSKTDVPMDRYIEAVNRKVSLESNGISKKNPMTEGLMKKCDLATAIALSGSGGC